MQDSRELQAAMSSVATGVRVLLEQVGLEAGDIEEVMLAGSFGSSIDPESARVIGLVPPVPVEKIRFASVGIGVFFSISIEKRSPTLAMPSA